MPDGREETNKQTNKQTQKKFSWTLDEVDGFVFFGKQMHKQV